MSQENVRLVQSIYAAWARGDFSSAEWAHPEIECVRADGPDPGAWTGVTGMAEAWREFMGAWEGYRIEVEEYRELDSERVVAFTQRRALGVFASRATAAQGEDFGSPARHVKAGTRIHQGCKAPASCCPIKPGPTS